MNCFIQLRALQGQQRALVALKKRSEQRLVEQQELNYKNNTSSKTILEENDLLSDIHNIRNRYEEFALILWKKCMIFRLV